MKLVGKRILIRDLSFSDIDDYYAYGKDELVGPSAGWKPFPDIEIAKRVLTNNIISKETYAIVLKESKTLIGTISIYSNAIRKYNKAKSLGFSLASKYWNNGYMTEAVKLILEYIFTKTDCEILEVGHHVGNFASKRVIEKCGFNYDGRFIYYKKLYDDRLVDADFYSMTKVDYERKKKYE